MPFTMSHAAAVIPLARGPLVPSALVVGSMVPDVPYFLGMGALRGATHVPLGLVTIDLGLGLIIFAAFQLIWKRPLLALTPGWAHVRLAVPAAAFRRSMIKWVPFSLVLGAATHLFWDAFTHKHHSFAGELPWLISTSWGGLTLNRWLQYASGVLGAAVVVWWLVRWVRTAPVTADAPERLPGRVAWTVVGALVIATCGGGLLGAVTLINQPDVARTFHMTLVSGVEGAIAGLGVALTLYGLAWTVVTRRRRGGTAVAEPESGERGGPAPSDVGAGR
ncbi:DUF4184 family protein [Actinomadura rudentiformis]|uniref:DUF4184 family protein n=1 Tax=Actinomadura rudentiformis TaxID=359158 RepID=A0A6H9YJ19_9ACTN|nr:DUF4184 family protein [Actinomadura rudentiformis]KAB2346813.1 DUF4184 family protein [Actinomadura rudentiformis]